MIQIKTVDDKVISCDYQDLKLSVLIADVGKNKQPQDIIDLKCEHLTSEILTDIIVKWFVCLEYPLRIKDYYPVL